MKVNQHILLFSRYKASLRMPSHAETAEGAAAADVDPFTKLEVAAFGIVSNKI